MSIFWGVNGNCALLKTFDSIFYLGVITCFVYPRANRTLLVLVVWGHSRWSLTFTQIVFLRAIFSFVRHFEFSSAYRCTLVSRLPFPVPCSPFLVPRQPFPVPSFLFIVSRFPFLFSHFPFPVPRSRFRY